MLILNAMVSQSRDIMLTIKRMYSKDSKLDIDVLNKFYQSKITLEDLSFAKPEFSDEICYKIKDECKQLKIDFNLKEESFEITDIIVVRNKTEILYKEAINWI